MYALRRRENKAAFPDLDIYRKIPASSAFLTPTWNPKAIYAAPYVVLLLIGPEAVLGVLGAVLMLQAILQLGGSRTSISPSNSKISVVLGVLGRHVRLLGVVVTRSSRSAESAHYLHPLWSHRSSNQYMQRLTPTCILYRHRGS
jgi:hypothetical protein